MNPVRRPEGFPGQRLVVLPADIVKRGSTMPVVRDLQVTHLGHFNPAPGHFVRRPQGAPQWILIFCLAGLGAAEWNGRRWRIDPGDLLVLPPDEAHLYESDLIAPWNILWVHFTGRRATDHMEAIGWKRETPVLHVPAIRKIEEIFEDLYGHTHRGFPEAALLGLGADFARLLATARMESRARDRRLRRTEAKVLEVLRLLREAPERRWTVPQMARAAGLSTTRFAEIFHQHTGSPPLTFLIRLRLQRACQILESGDATVEETARQVGYHDATYFSRLFRSHLGVSPSRFRTAATKHQSLT